MLLKTVDQPVLMSFFNKLLDPPFLFSCQNGGFFWLSKMARERPQNDPFLVLLVSSKIDPLSLLIKLICTCSYLEESIEKIILIATIVNSKDCSSTN